MGGSPVAVCLLLAAGLILNGFDFVKAQEGYLEHSRYRGLHQQNGRHHNEGGYLNRGRSQSEDEGNPTGQPFQKRAKPQVQLLPQPHGGDPSEGGSNKREKSRAWVQGGPVPSSAPIAIELQHTWQSSRRRLFQSELPEGLLIDLFTRSEPPGVFYSNDFQLLGLQAAAQTGNFQPGGPPGAPPTKAFQGDGAPSDLFRLDSGGEGHSPTDFQPGSQTVDQSQGSPGSTSNFGQNPSGQSERGQSEFSPPGTSPPDSFQPGKPPSEGQPNVPQPGGGPSSGSDSEKTSSENSQGPGGPPAKPGGPPTKPGGPPTKPGGPPTKPDGPPTQPGGPPTKPDEPPTKPGGPPTKPDEPPTKPGDSSDAFPGSERPPVVEGSPSGTPEGGDEPKQTPSGEGSPQNPTPEAGGSFPTGSPPIQEPTPAPSPETAMFTQPEAGPPPSPDIPAPVGEGGKPESAAPEGFVPSTEGGAPENPVAPGVENDGTDGIPSAEGTPDAEKLSPSSEGVQEGSPDAEASPPFAEIIPESESPGPSGEGDSPFPAPAPDVEIDEETVVEVQEAVKEANVELIVDVLTEPTQTVPTLAKGFTFEAEERQEILRKSETRVERERDPDVVSIKGIVQAVAQTNDFERLASVMVLSVFPDGNSTVLAELKEILKDRELIDEIIAADPTTQFLPTSGRRRLACDACTPVNSLVCAHCWAAEICAPFHWCPPASGKKKKEGNKSTEDKKDTKGKQNTEEALEGSLGEYGDAIGDLDENALRDLSAPTTFEHIKP